MKLFIKNTVKLSSAPILTQIFSFFLLPLITRTYSAEIFGDVNLITSFVSLIGVFICLGYNQAIVFPKSDEDAIYLLQISVLLTFIISFFALIFIHFFYVNLFYEKIKLKSSLLYYFPFLLLLHGLSSSFLMINLRLSKFGLISIGRVLNVLASKMFSIIYPFFFTITAYGLILGNIAGTLILTLIFIFSNLKILKKVVQFNFKKYNSLLKEYQQFPFFAVTNDLVFRVNQTLMVILISYFYSNKDVGQYGVSLMILAIPTTLLGSSISEVFYKKIFEINNSDDLKESTIKLFKITTLILSLMFVILAFFSKIMIPEFLGDGWVLSGFMVGALSLYYFFEFIFLPCQSILKKFKKQQYILIYQLAITFSSFVSLFVGYRLNNIINSFYLLSILNAIISILFGLITFEIIGIRVHDIMKILFKTLVYNLPFILLFFFIQKIFLLNVVSIFILSIISYILFIWILIYKEYDFNNYSKEIALKFFGKNLKNGT